jgi:hypothetical protein
MTTLRLLIWLGSENHLDINFDGDAQKTGGILLSDKYEVAKS